jgi:hypothetical protein
VIPGHGLEPVPRERVEKYKQDLDKFIYRATALIREGIPRDQLVSQVRGDDLGWSLASPAWSRPETVGHIYDELAASPQ